MTELQIGAKILNKFIQLGMPKYGKTLDKLGGQGQSQQEFDVRNNAMPRNQISGITLKIFGTGFPHIYKKIGN